MQYSRTALLVAAALAACGGAREARSPVTTQPPVIAAGSTDATVAVDTSQDRRAIRTSMGTTPAARRGLHPA
jgi:hypothetical protein